MDRSFGHKVWASPSDDASLGEKRLSVARLGSDISAPSGESAPIHFRLHH
jgi:hypothetical protein